MTRFGCRFWAILAPKTPPLQLSPGAPFSVLKSLFFLHVVLVASNSAQEAPKRAQDPPKRCPRGPKTPQKHPKKPQDSPKSTPGTSEIDVSQRPCPKSQNEKRRAGGGDPPWGSQSAARSAAEEQGVLDRTPKSVHRKALICLRHLQISKSEFLAPPIIPPGGQRIPPGRPKNARSDRLFSIEISIMF